MTAKTTVAALIMWVVIGGFLFLNVHLEEVIGRQAPLETEDNENNYPLAVQMYNWFGGLGWGLLLGGMSAIVMIATRMEKRDQASLAFLVYCIITFYVHMVVMGFVEPNKEWRKLELAEGGLAMGGTVRRGCFHNSIPLTVPKNETYVDLLDPEWYVDTTTAHSSSEYGYTWRLGMIRYNGTVQGCHFNPPIWAACVESDPLTAEKCGWVGWPRRVTIRKLKVSHEMEAFIRHKLPWKTATGLADRNAAFEYIYEWNSYWREEIEEYVDGIKDSARRQWRNYAISWFTTTGVPFIMILLHKCYRRYQRRRNIRAEQHRAGSSGDRDMETVPEAAA